VPVCQDKVFREQLPDSFHGEMLITRLAGGERFFHIAKVYWQSTAKVFWQNTVQNQSSLLTRYVPLSSLVLQRCRWQFCFNHRHNICKALCLQFSFNLQHSFYKSLCTASHCFPFLQAETCTQAIFPPSSLKLTNVRM